MVRKDSIQPKQQQATSPTAVTVKQLQLWKQKMAEAEEEDLETDRSIAKLMLQLKSTVPATNSRQAAFPDRLEIDTLRLEQSIQALTRELEPGR
jgi:hypothetical protein